MNPYVIPLVPDGKIPQASVYTAKPQTEWAVDTNRWGVACGPNSDVFVVDFDTYKGFPTDHDLAQLLANSTTRKVQTPNGGTHLYFRWVDGISNAGGEPGRVDIRGIGGYVATGDGYTVLNDVEPEEAPAWLVERLRAATTTIRESEPPAQFTAELGELVAALPVEMRGLYTEEGVQGSRSDRVWRLIKDLCELGWDIEDSFLIVRNSQDVLAKGWEDASVWSQVQKAYAECKPRKDLWNSRPILAAIREEARLSKVAPKAMLGALLTSAAHMIPWNVGLRTYREKPMSLNLGIVLYGRSGSGKDAAASEARTLFPVGVPVPRESVRSGEAIPDAFGSLNESAGAFEWHQPGHNMHFEFAEVTSLEKLMDRQGATLGIMLTLMLSADRIGGKKAGNKGASVPADAYRATFSVNAQPGQSGVLVSKESVNSGLTGRLLWVPAEVQETLSFEEFMALHGKPRRRFKVPEVDWSGVESIKALEAINRAFYTDDSEAIDGQGIRLRSVVACCLMVLDGRTALNEEDWELSGQVMGWSRETRTAAIDAQSNVAFETKVSTLAMDKRVEKEVNDGPARVANKIERKVAERGKVTSVSALKKLNYINQADKSFRDAALEILAARGVEVFES